MRGEVEHALRNPKSPEEYREVLSSTLEEVVGLSAIVDDLLTLSKADLKQHVVVRDRINLKDFIAELYEDSTIIAEKKRISVVLQKNEEVVIVGDKMHLRRLFLNLVDNAIKYTPEGGAIRLAAAWHEDNLDISVSDTGEGIPPEDLPRVFDRFYRGDAARTRAQGGEPRRASAGAGLGLAIARAVVEAHGGRIWATSTPGTGSTFTFSLPPLDEKDAEAARTAETARS
jgi:signal transduction histidine kinase